MKLNRRVTIITRFSGIMFSLLLFAGVAGQPACTVVKVGVGGSNRLRIALYHFFEFDFGERSGGVG